jgi:hypothetical protein
LEEGSADVVACHCCLIYEYFTKHIRYKQFSTSTTV